MAAIINRSFGCYKTADISKYKDVSKDKWYLQRCCHGGANGNIQRQIEHGNGPGRTDQQAGGNDSCSKSVRFGL